jgi:hypothetical protein
MPLAWLAHIPMWLLAVVVVGGFIGCAVGGLALTRRWMRRVPDHPNDLAGFVYAVVGVTYAVLLGMSALSAYERFNDVAQTASMEANTVGDLYRDLEGYPDPTGDRLQEKLHRYLHDVAERELPALRRGEEPPSLDPQIDAIVLDWVAFEPRTEGQKALHAEALSQLNQFLTLRRTRLHEGRKGLHPVVWFVLLTGAALTIGFTYLFWASSHRLHGLMVGCLAGVLGLTVFWMVAMDVPLAGPLAIPPDAFDDVLRTADRISHGRWDLPSPAGAPKSR